MTVLLKTLTDNVALFNDNGLYFLDQNEAIQIEKLIFASGLMLLAGIGICLQPQFGIGYLAFLWSILLLGWVIYFLENFFRNNYPDRLFYRDIDKVAVFFKYDHYEITIYPTESGKPVRLSTRVIDEKVFDLLFEKGIRLK